jgi:hypothetical protein
MNDNTVKDTAEDDGNYRLKNKLRLKTSDKSKGIDMKRSKDKNQITEKTTDTHESPDLDLESFLRVEDKPATILREAPGCKMKSLEDFGIERNMCGVPRLSRNGNFAHTDNITN